MRTDLPGGELGADECAGQINSHGPFETVSACILQRGAASRDAGIVHENRQRAKSILSMFYCRRNIRLNPAKIMTAVVLNGIQLVLVKL